MRYTTIGTHANEAELGSPHLAAAVERYRDELAADMFVTFDGPPHVSGAPTVWFGPSVWIGFGSATAAAELWARLRPVPTVDVPTRWSARPRRDHAPSSSDRGC